MKILLFATTKLNAGGFFLFILLFFIWFCASVFLCVVDIIIFALLMFYFVKFVFFLSLSKKLFSVVQTKIMNLNYFLIVVELVHLRDLMEMIKQL